MLYPEDLVICKVNKRELAKGIHRRRQSSQDADVVRSNVLVKVESPFQHRRYHLVDAQLICI